MVRSDAHTKVKTLNSFCFVFCFRKDFHIVRVNIHFFFNYSSIINCSRWSLHACRILERTFHFFNFFLKKSSFLFFSFDTTALLYYSSIFYTLLTCQWCQRSVSVDRGACFGSLSLLLLSSWGGKIRAECWVRILWVMDGYFGVHPQFLSY